MLAWCGTAWPNPSAIRSGCTEHNQFPHEYFHDEDDENINQWNYRELLQRKVFP
jgi:hypothetical protein